MPGEQIAKSDVIVLSRATFWTKTLIKNDGFANQLETQGQKDDCISHCNTEKCINIKPFIPTTSYSKTKRKTKKAECYW